MRLQTRTKQLDCERNVVSCEGGLCQPYFTVLTVIADIHKNNYVCELNERQSTKSVCIRMQSLERTGIVSREHGRVYAYYVNNRSPEQQMRRLEKEKWKSNPSTNPVRRNNLC